MARRTDAGFQYLEENAAAPCDEIDAGWDDASSNANPAPAPTTSFPPVSASRKLTRRREPVRDDELFGPETLRGPPIASEPPRSVEVDISDYRPRQLGGVLVVAAIGVIVALVVGSVGRDQFPTPAEPAAEIGALRPPKDPVPPPSPELRGPEPASSATTPPNEAATARAPVQPARVGTSLETGSNAVTPSPSASTSDTAAE